MPIPLIIVVVSSVAAGAGGTAVTGAGVWYFFFREKKIENQSNASIVDAEKAVSILQKDVRDGSISVRESILSVSDSQNGLQQSISSMVAMTQQLASASCHIASSTAVMVTLLPRLQTMAEKTEQDSLTLFARLCDLNLHLGEREGEIRLAKKKIENLSEVVVTQSTVIEQLTEAVRKLTGENHDLRNCLTEQKHKYERLESAAKHAQRNYRLFRSSIQESMILPVDRDSTQLTLTQTFFR